MTLTLKKIKAMEPNTYYWDQGVTGFGVRSTPNGTKSFVIRIPHKAKNSKGEVVHRRKIRVYKRFRDNMTSEELSRIRLAAAQEIEIQRASEEIGEAYGTALLSPDLAGAVVRLPSGIEIPLARLRGGSSGESVSEAVERYKEQRFPKLKPKTVKYYRHCLKILCDGLGDQPVSRVAEMDMLRLLDNLSDRPGIMSNAYSVWNLFFNWSERAGIRPRATNPMGHIDPPKLEPVGHAFSLPQIRAIWDAVDRTEADGSIRPGAATMIRLLIVTGRRPIEIQRLRWDQLDMDSMHMDLLDTKTTDQRVPLSPLAMRVIRRASRVVGNPYVCPGPGQGQTKNHAHIWRKIWKSSGLSVCPKCKSHGHRHCRMYDLRHTAVTLATEAGFGLDAAGKAVGHSNLRTTRVYDHDVASARSVVDGLSDILTSALGLTG